MKINNKEINDSLNEVIELQNTLRHYRSGTQKNIVSIGIMEFIKELKIYGGNNFENKYRDKLDIIKNNLIDQQKRITNKYK